MNKEVLIVMGRYPTDTKNMSRLAQELDVKETRALYRDWVNRLFDEELVKLPDVTTIFLYPGKKYKPRVERWIGPRAICFDPVSDDAEINLAAAFEKAFSEGAEKVGSIATDVPDLTGEEILNAFAALKRPGVAIGRDLTDGIYMFVTNVWNPKFLQRDKEIPPYQWANQVAIEDGLSRYLLPKKRDIDTLRDLQIWQATQGKKG